MHEVKYITIAIASGDDVTFGHQDGIISMHRRRSRVMDGVDL